MKRKNKFKQVILLSLFILCSQAVLAKSGNTSDAFNGSYTAIESIGVNIAATKVPYPAPGKGNADKAPPFYKSSQSEGEAEGEGEATSTEVTEAYIPGIKGVLGNAVAKLAGLLDGLEGGINQSTELPELHEDYFNMPLSAEAETATETQATSSTEAPEQPIEISANLTKASTRDYY
jgi:hypothetical protein